ncbi:MAG: OmpA family protein [Bacteroidota bacterium]
MRKYFLFAIVLFLFFISESIQAQLAKDSWGLGFGFKYPRFLSINTTISNTNYGGFLSIQRNFSEHVALRLGGFYSHLESEWTDPTNLKQTTSSDLLGGNLDLMVYLFPCEPVSIYIYGGAGVLYRMLDNKRTVTLDDNAIAGQLSSGLGIEWEIASDWKFVSEFGYNLGLNSELEGAIGAGEVNGRDSYLKANLGLLWYFSKGEPSKYCQLYSGLSQQMPDPVDYERIEEMIKRHIPREVVKEVVVEKPVASVDKWVLVGVNFEFNSTKISPESYPILFDAVKTLLKNTDLRIEIQGYTDNIGSESYNMKLSQRRAEAVKGYLQSKGISGSRLRATGFGESNPVADNKTAEGRAMNRRIEFKIQ